MAQKLPAKKFKSLPVQVIESKDGVLLKRGCTEFKISGDHAASAVQKVLGASSNGGATHEEIYRLFVPQEVPIVNDLIEQLLVRRLLVLDGAEESGLESQESNLDIFYWHFGENSIRVNERITKHRILILGVNCISRQLAASLATSGVDSFRVVDHPLLRNRRLFDDKGKLKSDVWNTCLESPLAWTEHIDFKAVDCLVATSDFGDHEALREWNRVCVKENRHFLPVVLKDLIGYVGPFVIPGETACFECLHARQNSHLKDYGSRRIAERYAFQGQQVVGFHPSMASILGDIAAFELAKQYSEIRPLRKVGTLIEVNLLAPEMKAHKVLKVPRCPTCSPLNIRSSTMPDKAVFAPAQTEDD